MISKRLLQLKPSYLYFRPKKRKHGVYQKTHFPEICSRLYFSLDMNCETFLCLASKEAQKYNVLTRHTVIWKKKNKKKWTSLSMEIMDIVDKPASAGCVLHHVLCWNYARYPGSFCCSFSRIWFFATPRIAACQALLSFTVSQSLLKLISIGGWKKLDTT